MRRKPLASAAPSPPAGRPRRSSDAPGFRRAGPADAPPRPPKDAAASEPTTASQATSGGDGTACAAKVVLTGTDRPAASESPGRRVTAPVCRAGSRPAWPWPGLLAVSGAGDAAPACLGGALPGSVGLCAFS